MAVKELMLIKRGQYYLFRYQEEDRALMVECLVAKARDPNCDLDWLDIAILAHQMGRKSAEEILNLVKQELGWH